MMMAMKRSPSFVRGAPARRPGPWWRFPDSCGPGRGSPRSCAQREGLGGGHRAEAGNRLFLRAFSGLVCTGAACSDVTPSQQGGAARHAPR